MNIFLKMFAWMGAGLLLLSLLSCTAPGMVADTNVSDEKQDRQTDETQMPSEIQINISGKTLPVKIEDNAATRALLDALRNGAITYEADDYGGFEKVGNLGFSLPASNSQITTQPGDVILYNGNNIVLFYGSNSWSYTRIGKIQYSTQEQLNSFLKAGQGEIIVVLSL